MVEAKARLRGVALPIPEFDNSMAITPFAIVFFVGNSMVFSDIFGIIMFIAIYPFIFVAENIIAYGQAIKCRYWLSDKEIFPTKIIQLYYISYEKWNLIRKNGII